MAVNANVWSDVDEFKVYIGESTTDFDAVFEDLMNQAADMLEKILGRLVIDQASDITEIVDGDVENTGNYFVDVKNFPINSFTSVAFKTGPESSPTWVVQSADTYVKNDALGRIYFNADHNFFSRPLPNTRQSIRIIYQGGYTSGNVPNDLILMLHMQTAKLFNKRRSQGLINEKIGTAQIAWNPQMESELNQLILARRRFY